MNVGNEMGVVNQRTSLTESRDHFYKFISNDRNLAESKEKV